MKDPHHEGSGRPDDPAPDPEGDAQESEEILADLEPIPAASSEVSLPERARAWNDQRGFDVLALAARSVGANLDLPTLMPEILDSAVDLVGAERGILFLGRGPDKDMVPVVARGVGKAELRGLQHISQTVLRRVLQGQVMASGDAVRDPVLRDIPSINLSSVRSLLCVPLVARSGLIGALYVDNRRTPHLFSPSARRFLEAFAGLAAVALDNAELHDAMLRENRRLRSRLDTLEAFGRIHTGDAGMMALLRKAGLAARSDAPVLILGESGTGKELLARAIHDASERSLRPLIAHNCAAVPGLLMESLFFGHVKGAFTGAIRETQGLFQLAHQGDLFLDEVADLDLALQAKLLRVLEDGRVRPLGSEHELTVDIRLITATSRDLYEAMACGQFRRELFYRMAVVELRVPPLRERPGDIPLLVDHFMDKHGRGERVQLSAGALDTLCSYSWPGNIRELENLIRRVLILCPGPVVDRVDVEDLLIRTPDGHLPPPGAAGAVRETAPPRAVPGGAEAKESLADHERRLIEGALQRSRGNKSEAARALGLHRNVLLRKMQRLGICYGRGNPAP